jgi:hypothetical protein
MFNSGNIFLARLIPAVESLMITPQATEMTLLGATSLDGSL